MSRRSPPGTCGKGSGVILQTASTNGLVGHPYYADYNATKAGVIELTKSMALELAPNPRLRVAPGYVLTPMQRAEYTDEMLEKVNRKIPLGSARQAGGDRSPVCFSWLPTTPPTSPDTCTRSTAAKPPEDWPVAKR